MRKFRSVTILGMLAVALLVLPAMTCAQAAKTTEGAGTVLKTAAPFLPPPFNFLVGVAGAAIGALGAYAGNKSRVKKAAGLCTQGIDPMVAEASSHVLGKLVSERQWLYPFLAAVLGALQTSGTLPFDPGDIGGIIAALAGAGAAEFQFSQRADRQIAALPMVTNTGTRTGP